MPDPLRNTVDVPTFDNYPAAAPEEQDLSASALGGPVVEDSRQGYGANSNLNATAERIGSTVGNAVGAVRRRLQVVPGRIDEAKERLSEAGGDMREDVRAAAIEWREAAERRLSQARDQARRYANEKPFQVLAGAAVLGFVIGAGLRIWRSGDE